jgi:hypothetical protein
VPDPLGLPITLVGVAQAQSETLSLKEARKTFQRALELEQAKNWPEALRLFREVGEAKMTPQVRFHIALCEENLGKLVAALGGYELALADADAVGGDFKHDVETAIERLRARIPKLVIRRGEGASAAKIELDGVALGASSIGVEVPLDPGPHAVTATAPGYEDFSATVEVSEGQSQPLEIVMKKLPSTAGRPAVSSGVVDAGPTKPKRNLTIPLVALGAGGAALIGSGAFYILRLSAISNAEQECGGSLDNCPTSDKSYVDDQLSLAKRNTLIAQVLGGVGVVGVGVGVVLLAVPPKDAKQAQLPAKRARLALVPASPYADVGVSAVGRF